MPFSTMLTYSSLSASYPISGADVSILATTTDPSTPAFLAMVIAGIRKARFTMSIPVFCNGNKHKHEVVDDYHTNSKQLV